MLLDTNQFLLPNKTSTTRADRMIWVAFMALALPVLKAILTAGTCAIIQSLMDSLDTNWLLNTKIALCSMAVVGAVLILADMTLAALWLKFLLRQTARPVSQVVTPTGRRGKTTARSADGYSR